MAFGGEGKHPCLGAGPRVHSLGAEQPPFTPLSGCLGQCANCKAICSDPDGQTVKSVVVATIPLSSLTESRKCPLPPQAGGRELLLSLE